MIEQLATMFPELCFSPGEHYCWSPLEQKIIYRKGSMSQEGTWALLHETGHALLNHKSYGSDYELLLMEIAAWEKAKELAEKLGKKISEEHIQECLDSYRDWLYRRSICPNCGTKTIQKDLTNSYSCFNCHTCWQVSPSRFCRAYRTLKPEKEISLI